MNPENLTPLEAQYLPVGSVIEESAECEGGGPAALTKRGDDKWTCDRCEDPHSLSTIYRSLLTYSLKSLGELPEGFAFGTVNLELSKFAPEGTLVSDSDDDGAVWEKIGEHWLHGVSHKDRLAEAENWSPAWGSALNPAWVPYTVVSKDEPFSEEVKALYFNDGKLSAVEAEKLTDKVLRDSTGDRWKMIDGKWTFSVGGDGFSPFLGYRSDGLPQMFAPYEVVETEGLSGDDEIPRFKGQGDPQNEVSVVSFGSDVPVRVFDISTGAEKPSITESLVNITNALERIAAALEENK